MITHLVASKSRIAQTRSYDGRTPPGDCRRRIIVGRIMATWLPARQRSSTSLETGYRCITVGNSRFRARTHNGGNQCAIFTTVTDGIMADVGQGVAVCSRQLRRIVRPSRCNYRRRQFDQFCVPRDNQSSDQISQAYLTGPGQSSLSLSTSMLLDSLRSSTLPLFCITWDWNSV